VSEAIKKTEQRRLPVKLTSEELLAKADELSRKLGDKQQEERDQKTTKDAMKERLSGLDAEIASLAEIVRSKQEERLVDIYERFDTGRLVVEQIRLDTGEVVGTRTMTVEERNLKLFPREIPGIESEA
jgi:hypothetical protein